VAPLGLLVRYEHHVAVCVASHNRTVLRRVSRPCALAEHDPPSF
jgi:hypothetical protein